MSIKFDHKKDPLLKSQHIALVATEQSVTVFIMVQYFVALLVLCVSGSLGTTTKPAQQNTNTVNDLCQVSTKI